MKYEQVLLSDIFRIERGGSPRPIQDYLTNDEDGINWIMISDASNSSKYIGHVKNKIKVEGVSKSRMVYPGDLLLTNSMSFGRPYIMNTSGCIHDGWLVFSRKTDQINTDLFYYLLSSNFLYAKFKRLASGATVKNLNIQLVKSVTIPLPPLPDQIRIAGLLTRAEKLIARRKESIKTLDEFLKSTFLEMFGDPVRNEKGWEKKELKYFGEIITGNTPPRNNPENYSTDFVEWIKTDNILMDRMYVTRASEFLSEKGLRSARIISSGALLVTCIAGSASSIGRVALANRTVSFNQQINAIQPSEQHNSLFLYWLFKISQQYIRGHATHGMKKILTKGEFEKIEMIVTPFPLQNRFAAIVEKVDALKASCRESLTELQMLYGSLSQRAFKGELDLSRVPVVYTAQTVTAELHLTGNGNVEYSETSGYFTQKLLTVIHSFSGTPFSFKTLMEKLEKTPFGDTTDYQKVKKHVFDMLSGKKPFLKQVFDTEKKEMLLSENT